MLRQVVITVYLTGARLSILELFIPSLSKTFGEGVTWAADGGREEKKNGPGLGRCVRHAALCGIVGRSELSFRGIK